MWDVRWLNKLFVEQLVGFDFKSFASLQLIK